MAALKKLDTAIGSVEKTLRTPGSNCIDEALHAPLKLIMAQLAEAKAYVEGFIFGQCDWKAFDLQIDVQQLIATAKKHEAVFQFNVRTFASK